MKIFGTEDYVYFGDVDAPPVDWRNIEIVNDEDPDDDELPETPADVVAILGFDPIAERALDSRKK